MTGSWQICKLVSQLQQKSLRICNHLVLLLWRRSEMSHCQSCCCENHQDPPAYPCHDHNCITSVPACQFHEIWAHLQQSLLHQQQQQQLLASLTPSPPLPSMPAPAPAPAPLVTIRSGRRIRLEMKTEVAVVRPRRWRWQVQIGRTRQLQSENVTASSTTNSSASNTTGSSATCTRTRPTSYNHRPVRMHLISGYYETNDTHRRAIHQ